MNRETKILAGIIIVTIPTIVYGGFSLLGFLARPGSFYYTDPYIQNFFRAGHAHAGVLVTLSLVFLLYVDKTALSDGLRWYVRLSVPAAALLVPAGFFFSVLPVGVSEVNAFIYLAYAGAALVFVGALLLGIGLLRSAGSGR